MRWIHHTQISIQFQFFTFINSAPLDEKHEHKSSSLFILILYKETTSYSMSHKSNEINETKTGLSVFKSSTCRCWLQQRKNECSTNTNIVCLLRLIKDRPKHRHAHMLQCSSCLSVCRTTTTRLNRAKTQSIFFFKARARQMSEPKVLGFGDQCLPQKYAQHICVANRMTW